MHRSSQARILQLSSLAVIAVTLCAVAVVPGCSAKEPRDEREDVRRVVREFVDTGKRGALAEHVALLSRTESEAARADADYSPLIAASEMLDYVVGRAIVEGDLASVHLSLKEDDWTDAFDVILAREQGEWRVMQEATVERIAKRMLGETQDVTAFLNALADSEEAAAIEAGIATETP